MSPSIHKSVYLFGYPIAHSAAPTLHNMCFQSIGSPCEYERWSTTKVDQKVIDELRSHTSGGAAVTMPLKAEILKHLDEISPESYATGACNTVVRVPREDGSIKLVGTNTDFLGVRNSLVSALQAQFPETPFDISQTYPAGQASGMVIGGGATTRSAVHALYTLGMNPIFLANRDAEEVRVTIEEFASKRKGGKGVELIHLTSVDEVERYLGQDAEDRKPGVAMIVGAIPAIAPKTLEERMVYTIATHIFTMPFQAGPTDSTSSPNPLPLPSTRLFLDMAYKPRLTPLLKIGSALGWQTIGGIQAMIEQGLAQQRMWKVGSASLEVACDKTLLGDDTERKARELVENMKDITVTELEVDRALT
ncbi:hypothetical protein HD553DRAFT_348725 [Filobasidium floriforme]|uniref:uncharacterized protein n=1 Tax=Filobasidium floriforme TaxID=5210 RepID=UPI001E8ED5B1|nr:uncharacterized protein HD553DRAFT_348725 [Filobasidium floriforme]KAH8088210.1 hypothetical protein HD553DRAFT_348725 [Filobasidium floriforme]